MIVEFAILFLIALAATEYSQRRKAIKLKVFTNGGLGST